MARAFGYQAGGILSLDALVEEHQFALESDLIDRGLRLRQLGTSDLSWGDLRAIVTCVHPQSSALARARNPEQWQWQLSEQILADAADNLRLLWWAKTEDGQENRNRPQRIQRPGVRDESERYGNEPVSIADMNQFLGWEAA